jgi:ATP-dependent helicase HrpA
MARIDPQLDFHVALAAWIDDIVRAAGGAQALLAFAGEGGVSAAMLAELPIAEHLRINLQVLDLEGRMLAQGRDLQALKRRLREHEFETAPLSPAPPWSSQRVARSAPALETRSAPAAREGHARREQRGSQAAAGRVSRATAGEQGSTSATTRAVPAKGTADARVSAAPASRAPPVNRVAVERTAAERSHRAWDFGELPASREVERGGLRYTVYPGLVDHGDGVTVAEFAHDAPAQGSLRAGILRLAMLALSDQYKYVRGRFAQERELVLLGQGMNTRQPLADALAQQVFADGLLPTGLEGGARVTASSSQGDALPRNAQQFQALLDRHRAGLAEVAERMLVQTVQVLRDLRAVRQGLARLNAPGYLPLQQDVQAQLRQLAPEDFPGGVPALLWPHLPRYMKALARRIEKAAGNVRRDEELLARLTPFTRACEQLETQARGAPLRAELDRLQWLLQEFRVSLFAQDLRTAAPVSEKRLTDQLERARAELRQDSSRSRT